MDAFEKFEKGVLRGSVVADVELSTPLNNVVFIQCRFQNVVFKNDLNSVDFQQCSFLNVSFTNLYNVVFHKSIAKHLILPENKVLDHIEFHDCKIGHSSLGFLQLHNSSFFNTECDHLALKHPFFKNVTIQGGSWKECKMVHGTFIDTEFEKCQLKECILNKNNYSRCVWKSLRLISGHGDLCTYSGNTFINVGFVNMDMVRCHVSASTYKRCVWDRCLLNVSVFNQVQFMSCRLLGSTNLHTTMSHVGMHGCSLLKTVMEHGVYNDVKLLNHQEHDTSWKDSTFRNLERKTVQHVTGQCFFTDNDFKSAFNISITPECDGIKGPVCEVQPDATFRMRSIHSYDFLHIDAEPSSYFSRLFTYSQRNDVFEVMTHIMIDGTLFVRHARKGYVRTPVLKKYHSI